MRLAVSRTRQIAKIIPWALPPETPDAEKSHSASRNATHARCATTRSLVVAWSSFRRAVICRLDLPRFRGEMRAWDQALWLCVMLSSGFVAFFSSTPAELFFRPDPRTDGAAARSGGQGRPLAAAARRACP